MSSILSVEGLTERNELYISGFHLFIGLLATTHVVIIAPTKKKTKNDFKIKKLTDEMLYFDSGSVTNIYYKCSFRS